MLDHGKCALQVDRDHVVPFFFAHIKDHAVPEDPGAGYDDIQLAVIFHRSLDDPLAAIHRDNRLQTRRGFAAGLLDLGHHGTGERVVGAGAVDVDTRIHHHYFRPLFGHQHGDAPSDSPARAGHYRYFVLE